MSRLTTGAIHALIAVLSLILVLALWVFVNLEIDELGSTVHEPTYDPVRFVIVVTCVQLFLVCALALLACVWRLVSLARSGRIFDERAFVWVNGSLAATLAATGLDLVATASVILIGEVGVPPLVPVIGIVGAIVGAGAALVIVVMRALLRQATDLRTELAEVV